MTSYAESHGVFPPVSIQSLEIHHKDPYHRVQSDVREFTLTATGNPVSKAPSPYYLGGSMEPCVFAIGDVLPPTPLYAQALWKTWLSMPGETQETCILTMEQYEEEEAA